jgi:hypothetical protein
MANVEAFDSLPLAIVKDDNDFVGQGLRLA